MQRWEIAFQSKRLMRQANIVHNLSSRGCPLKLVVTGASGFLGKQLVSRLQNSAALQLAGRRPDDLRRDFPGVPTTDYQSLSDVGRGADALLHLAVLNNTQAGTVDDFRSVNVDFARQVAVDASAAGIPVFVNFCSFHALPGGPDTPYARSKRDGAEALQKIEGLKVINLYLPAVYGDHFAGKLAVLEKLPGVLRRPAFALLSALAPTVHVDRIAAFVTNDIAQAPSDEPVYLADPKDRNWAYVFGRKVIDYGFALSVLLLFWWLLALFWVLVKVGSPGPGIFAQDRVGKAGKVFTCYKFRSMRQGTRQAGTHEISESAVTKVGAFMRKTKIDELPQIWNILKGELSLVGPRPCLPVQEALVEERRKRGGLDVLPGITGLAQIEGIDMSDPVRLARKDAQYVARRGLVLDLKIILSTFTGKGQGDRTSR